MAPHCASLVHVAGTPSAMIGKNWSPTPSPFDPGSAKNAPSASVTAFHFVGWP